MANGQILLVEDNDDDVLMIKRGLKKAQTSCILHHVINGRLGLEYLSEHNACDVRLIILDLNMEVMDGFEFLACRKESAEFQRIPVVVFSSSLRSVDIERAYALGANSYVEKPLEPAEFMAAISSIEDFWINFARIVTLRNTWMP